MINLQFFSIIYLNILGYMRAEKQKETEMRMNAELELQRIRTQLTVDQQKIAVLEADLGKFRMEAEVKNFIRYNLMKF